MSLADNTANEEMMSARIMKKNVGPHTVRM